jgi:hypothetical protein
MFSKSARRVIPSESSTGWRIRPDAFRRDVGAIRPILDKNVAQTCRTAARLRHPRIQRKPTNEPGMLMKTKASPLENPNASIRQQARGLCFFVLSAQNLGQEASPWADNGPRARVREAGGPGDRLVPFPMDILSLILLIAARILSRLSVPPQLRRI